MNRPGPAYALAGLAVVLWSTVATAFKLALAHLDVFQLVFFASAVSVIVLLTFVAVSGRLGQLPGTLRRHWRVTLASAALNPVCYYLILFAAYDRLPAQVAQPINYTWAIVLSFMSIVFLKQKLLPVDIGAALVCYLGVVIIAGQGEWFAFAATDFGGLALALLSTFVWATYWVLNVADEREPLIALTLNFLVALPASLALCLVFSDPLDVSLAGLAGAAWVGLFEMSLAFLCWSHALRLASNTARVSNLIFLSPFLSLLLINQVLGEPLYATTWIGLVIIVAGLLLQQARVRAVADR